MTVVEEHATEVRTAIEGLVRQGRLEDLVAWLTAAIDAAITEEREACAKVAEAGTERKYDADPFRCVIHERHETAAAIRART